MHPKKFDLKYTGRGEIERRLILGDSLDVSFKNPSFWIAVEVKSHVSNEIDLIHGLFQCVKYKAVMQAFIGMFDPPKSVDAILLVEGILEPKIVAMAHALGISFIEVKQYKHG